MDERLPLIHVTISDMQANANVVSAGAAASAGWVDGSSSGRSSRALSTFIRDNFFISPKRRGSVANTSIRRQRGARTGSLSGGCRDRGAWARPALRDRVHHYLHLLRGGGASDRVLGSRSSLRRPLRRDRVRRHELRRRSVSRIGPRPTPATPVWVSGLLVHMFLIGVPSTLRRVGRSVGEPRLTVRPSGWPDRADD